MQEQLAIMTEQMLSVAILVAIGFLAGKGGVLKDQVLAGLSGVITKILLPATVVTLIPMENGREELAAGLPVLLASVGIIAVMFLLAGVCVGKLCSLKGTTYNIHLVCASFGNMGLMGIPIVSAVFGQVGLLYLSLYLLMDQLLLWTAGNLFIYKDTGNTQGFQPRKLVTPTTIALVIGLVLLLAGVTPRGIVYNTLNTLGAATKPVAMVYLGGTLCALRLRDLKGKGSLLLLSLVKMVAVPLLVFWVLGLMPTLFNPMARMVLAVCAGMPTMLTVSMLARSAGSDGDYASQATLLTTLLSIGTLPLVSLLTGMLGG